MRKKLSVLFLIFGLVIQSFAAVSQQQKQEVKAAERYPYCIYESPEASVTKSYESYKDNWCLWWIPAELEAGKSYRIKGEYKSSGTQALGAVLCQVNANNYNFPIIYQDSDVSENVWHKVDVTFKIPKDAVNTSYMIGNKTGPLYFYFAKLDGYEKENTFSFRNFTIHTDTKPDIDNSRYNTSIETRYSDSVQRILADSRFASFAGIVKDVDCIIPGLEQTNVAQSQNVCKNMVPQGTCIAGNNILISAYCHDKKHPSVIYVMDKATKKYKTTIVLSNLKKGCHVGALAFNNSTRQIYIADSSENRVWVLPLLQISSQTDAKSVTLDKGKSIPVWDTPSFLYYCGGKLYVGTFGKSKFFNTSMKVYATDGSTTQDTPKEVVTLPPQCQGACIYEYSGKTYLIASCSYGRDHTSTIYAEELRKSKGGKVVNILKRFNNKMTFPNMSEDIEINGDRLYTCFESASHAYSNCPNPFDRIAISSARELLNTCSRQRLQAIDSSALFTEKEVVKEGECGEFLQYTLYKNGEMVLSGQGEMSDYSTEDTPWEEVKEKIKSLTIGADVESVSENAFSGCKNLKSAKISDFSNEEKTFLIRGRAFKGCTSLQQLELPDKRYEIAGGAFAGSQNLVIASDADSVEKYCDTNGIRVHTHDFKWEKTENATCASPGYDIYECECGKQQYQNMVNGTNRHNYFVIAEKTLSQNVRSVTYQCKNCNVTYTDEVTKTAAAVQPNKTVSVKRYIKAPGRVLKLKVKNRKKKTVILSWKKVKGAKGYQLQYAANKKFKKKKSKLTRKKKFTIKKLKKKKTYYFRVRAYKLNGKKKVYGKWSKIKKVKIRK